MYVFVCKKIPPALSLAKYIGPCSHIHIVTVPRYVIESEGRPCLWGWHSEKQADINNILPGKICVFEGCIDGRPSRLWEMAI